jgi:TM2 domain-containing membrane protein YozV
LILKSSSFGTPTSASGQALRSDRSPAMTLIISLLWPGAGHFYLGDKVKGILFSAAMAILSIATIPSMVGMMRPMMDSISAAAQNGDGTLSPTQVNFGSGASLGFITLLTTLLYIYAAIDAYATAKRAYRPQ